MKRVAGKKPDQDNGESGVRLGRLDEFIGFRLRRIQNQLSRDFAAATAERNLRSGLFSSLAIVAANPGISQNELSRAVGLDKSITVQIVDDLEGRDLARRERSPTDRRRHALFATESGQAYLDELFDTLAKTEDAVLHQLTKAELALLRELLDRMYEAYDEQGITL
ncbi:MarR family transcriptional regulator [Sphingobium sp. WCS2017Hpa-17]|uniref:MarR family winged helix-turn-helix transcriptional regulator n=1 Tax=Sphingobium sp. WCS2017Hpa-17 TaxID=3073638 RepID=UPI00288970D9|nr:MarR family transcriptional regulator [Sphingobium sp. WCS2017Hpa-17]